MKKQEKLLNRNFFLLWQGQLVSQLGAQAFAIAMMFWTKHQTGSATLMGLMLMISRLPAVILGPVAGTFADHFSRRKIIVWSDAVAGVSVLVLAWTTFSYGGSPGIVVVALFIVSLIIGIIRAFFTPAIAAAIPDLVPPDKLGAANSLNQGSNQVALFMGQALGGFLFQRLGAALLFLVNGITYLFSAFSETFIDIPQELLAKGRGRRELVATFKKDTAAGFKYVWHTKGIRDLFISMAVLNFFIMPFIVLLPFYVEDFLHAGAEWYGYIMAGFGFGSLVGYTAAGTLKLPAKKRGAAVIFSLVAMSACLPLFAFVHQTVPALLLMTGAGILNGFFNINVITTLQSRVEGDIRGRVFGLLTTLTAGIAPISMGLSGVVGDLLNHNIPLVFGLSGAITLALSILLVSLSKNLRTFLAH